MSHGAKPTGEGGDESQGISLNPKRKKRSRASAGGSEFADSEDEGEEERKSHLLAAKDFNKLELMKDDPVPPRLFKTK